MFFSTRSPLWAAEISISADTEIATEGYFVLSWTSSDDPSSSSSNFVLQQSLSDNFAQTRQLDVSAEGQITLSGLRDGLYYYRIGSSPFNDSQWSNTLSVEVAHHSLQRAFAFFSLGLALFVILVVSIIWGNKISRSNNHGS